MSTGIEWADETWNPLVGCSKVSEGCDNCYAIGASARMIANPKVDAYGGTVEDGDWTGALNLLHDRLDQPLRWKRPRRIFVNSMSDLFHPDVPAEFQAKVWATMSMAPQHRFMILTKRPRQMQFVEHPAFRLEVNAERLRRGVSVLPDSALPDGSYSWPLRNVWLGTSIELDKYTFRADYLRTTPAAVRFLSLEPLLGPLPSLDLTGIDWVIVGGESGSNARPMHPDWVRNIEELCHTAINPPQYIPFFFKQWGAWAPWTGESGVDMSWVPPADGAVAGTVRMARVGKRAAGRVIDGRTWDEEPS